MDVELAAQVDHGLTDIQSEAEQRRGGECPAISYGSGRVLVDVASRAIVVDGRKSEVVGGGSIRIGHSVPCVVQEGVQVAIPHVFVDQRVGLQWYANPYMVLGEKGSPRVLA